MKLSIVGLLLLFGLSHSARSAWIETAVNALPFPPDDSRTPQGVRGLKPADGQDDLGTAEAVALRKECVD